MVCMMVSAKPLLRSKHFADFLQLGFDLSLQFVLYSCCGAHCVCVCVSVGQWVGVGGWLGVCVFEVASFSLDLMQVVRCGAVYGGSYFPI